ncbi:MAG: biotin synthase BioB [Thermodesulfobacteriota bacterium]|nr:biotin synthase BioB [Thermodesulfobacteriota bacterium]
MGPIERAQQLYERATQNRANEDDLDTVIRWKEEELSALFACTDLVRRHFFGNTVRPCAIMNIKSGGCPEDCAFCSQSAHNRASITTAKLSEKHEIIECFKPAHARSLSFGVVSSGRRLSAEEVEYVAEALSECDGDVHASLGILNDRDFGLLRKAGVVCYNHNLETSREYFRKIVTTHTYDDRVETVKRAKQAGMAVCCGGIFGMGETWEDRKSLCLELKRLEVDTIPLNFLNAIPGTRVARPVESPLEFLKIISLFRIGHPDKGIKVCGGREINLGRAQNLMFYAGANGYISGDYLTTKGDGFESDDAMIEVLGLEKSAV